MTYWIWSIRPEHFPAFVRTGTFALRRQGRKALAAVRSGDRIFAYLPGSRVLAGAFEATGGAFEDTTALVPGGHYPHRLRVRPLTVLSEEAWIPYDAFAAKLAALDAYGEKETPDLRFRAMMQRVLHPLPTVDGLMLDYLVRTRAESDPERLVALTERYTREREAAQDGNGVGAVAEPRTDYRDRAFDRPGAMEELVAWVEAQGFMYEPWEIAAYVTALRTKPFVILAGITGVGKSKLPVLVAEATGAHASVLPVRPDWTDPAEVLGYTDLAGVFRPGALLHEARMAVEHTEPYRVLVLDEMNVARPEHYLAEVLSRMELRAPDGLGGWVSPPLLSPKSHDEDGEWSTVGLASNLALVGTVNVDESAHAFSRKVLDRAFVLELVASGFEHWRSTEHSALDVLGWPSWAWRPKALRLGQLDTRNEADVSIVEHVVSTLAELDAVLAPAGFGIGYRSRDEIALFVLHAQEVLPTFRTRTSESVGPLDLALLMKVLPRLEGSHPVLHSALLRLLGLLWRGTPFRDESDAVSVLHEWNEDNRPGAISGAPYPRTAARLARMVERMLDDGYASFWD